MDKVDSFLANNPSKDKLLKQIRRANNFIYRETEDGKHFYPSRFIGQKNYNIDDFINKDYKERGSGGDTDDRISSLLGIGKPSANIELSIELNAFVGKEVKNSKFWDFDFSTYNSNNNNN